MTDPILRFILKAAALASYVLVLLLLPPTITSLTNGHWYALFSLAFCIVVSACAYRFWRV